MFVVKVKRFIQSNILAYYLLLECKDTETNLAVNNWTLQALELKYFIRMTNQIFFFAEY